MACQHGSELTSIWDKYGRGIAALYTYLLVTLGTINFSVTGCGSQGRHVVVTQR